jgi:hypothetical protein
VPKHEAVCLKRHGLLAVEFSYNGHGDKTDARHTLVKDMRVNLLEYSKSNEHGYQDIFSPKAYSQLFVEVFLS